MNSIDNQWVNPQNPWNDRKQTGKQPLRLSLRSRSLPRSTPQIPDMPNNT
jgi:hypothetical protein